MLGEGGHERSRCSFWVVSHFLSLRSVLALAQEMGGEERRVVSPSTLSEVGGSLLSLSSSFSLSVPSYGRIMYIAVSLSFLPCLFLPLSLPCGPFVVFACACVGKGCLCVRSFCCGGCAGIFSDARQ